jgi:hypothetical protein
MFWKRMQFLLANAHRQLSIALKRKSNPPPHGSNQDIISVAWFQGQSCWNSSHAPTLALNRPQYTLKGIVPISSTTTRPRPLQDSPQYSPSEIPLRISELHDRRHRRSRHDPVVDTGNAPAIIGTPASVSLHLRTSVLVWWSTLTMHLPSLALQHHPCRHTEAMHQLPPMTI